MKIHRFFLLAGFLFVALFLVQAKAEAKDQWIQVKSRNFVLIGNASEKDIRRVGTRLEQFRETFRQLFKAVNLTGSIPTNVVVFKSDSSYKPFKPLRGDGKADTGIAGFFQPGEDVNYITLSTEGPDDDTFGTIFHEYVHFIIDTNFGRSEVPLWFNEGLAEYYQTFAIEQDIKVKLGLPQSDHLNLLQQSKLMPLDSLFNATSRQVHGTGGHSRSIFYAQSWALIHYLMQSGKSDALGKFLERLGAGTAPQKAFEESFQTTYKQMEADLVKYISKSTYQYNLITFKYKLTFDSEMQATVLDEPTSNAYLGDLLYHSNRADDAEPYLMKALSVEAGHPLANTALGMVKIRQRKFDDARTYLEKAIASDPKNHAAYYQYAYLLSREGRDEFGYVKSFAPETAAKMREVLRKAIALNPAFTESYELLAFVAVVNNDELDDAVVQLQKALRYQPGSQRYALRIAEIYSRQNKLTEAKAIAEKIARTTDDDEMRQRAEQITSMIAERLDFERVKAEMIKNSTSASIPGRSEGPPRLSRRKVSEAESANLYVNEALRHVLQGEQRVVGRVQKIDCRKMPIVYTIESGGATFSLTSKNFQDLTIGSFAEGLADLQVGCDANIAALNSVITYRPVGTGKPQGELVSIEFVSADFHLLSEEEVSRLQSASKADFEPPAPAPRPMIVETTSGAPDEAMRRKMMMDSVRAALKSPGPGEKREMGMLDKIECKGSDMLFSFKTQAAVVKLSASKAPQIIVFVQDLGGAQFGCGMKSIEFPAVFIYTDKPNPKSKTAGELIYLGFMPKSFTLE
jgi:tetratricopeptide (TPR) repeat protein